MIEDARELNQNIQVTSVPAEYLLNQRIEDSRNLTPANRVSFDMGSLIVTNKRSLLTVALLGSKETSIRAAPAHEIMCVTSLLSR